MDILQQTALPPLAVFYEYYPFYSSNAHLALPLILPTKAGLSFTRHMKNKTFYSFLHLNSTKPLAALALVCSLQACQSGLPIEKRGPLVAASAADTNALQNSFAKILSSAIKAEPELRDFLKQESIKQFDGDYDVLYQMVKDKQVNKSGSFHDILARYATASDLAAIEQGSPLLTIFIPDLPGGFTPTTWAASSQIPIVAICLRGDNKVPFYNVDGTQGVFQPGEVPVVPTLVVKQNERVVATSSLQRENSQELYFFRNDTFTYKFGDKAFDGIHPEAAHRPTSISRVGHGSTFDLKVLQAYNENGADPNVRWQRDYVYYGINATTTSGPLDRNYREYVKSMKFSASAFGLMSDQSEDPKTQTSSFPVMQGIPWTDGRFELRVSVFLNAKNGLGSEYRRMVSVNPGDLFDVKYTINTFRVTSTSITPKLYISNIDIVPWDLNSYGTAWKFEFYEQDASGSEQYSTSNSSTYAANFEVNIPTGNIIKVGGKFGASASTTSSSTYTITRNLGDDFLGESVLTFDRPILVSGSYIDDNLTTSEITTGGNDPRVSVSVEPMRFQY